MSKIVGAMNVRNEEWIVEYSLTALSEIVDEIVIVDDNSTDRTVEIAKRFSKVTGLYIKKPGKRTEVKDWNLLTKMAQKRGADWILFIDADEVFEPKMKGQIRKLVSDPDVGEYRFKKLTLWRSLDYYRVDLPEKFMPSGDVLLNPILIRNTPYLKWPYRPIWKQLLLLFLQGERFYPLVGQYGRLAPTGIEGKRVYVDDIVVLHFNHVDFNKLIKKQFEYIYWEIKAKPRKKAEEIVEWAMRNIDETGLLTAPVRPEWLWGFEHFIKLGSGKVLSDDLYYRGRARLGGGSAVIQETITYRCRRCDSPNIVKNGRNQCGNPQYHCKDCGAYRVLQPKVRYTQEEQEQILQVYQERASMRAIQRLFGVSRPTLATWLKKKSSGCPS